MVNRNPAMKRRTKAVLLVAGLAVATVVVLSAAPAVVLSATLTRGLTHGRCDMGLRNLIIGCTFKSARTITSQGTPAIANPSSPPVELGLIEETSWDVTDHCP